MDNPLGEGDFDSGGFEGAPDFEVGPAGGVGAVAYVAYPGSQFHGDARIGEGDNTDDDLRSALEPGVGGGEFIEDGDNLFEV